MLNGSVVSLDASLVVWIAGKALSRAERLSFAPICPYLVLELASPSDE